MLKFPRPTCFSKWGRERVYFLFNVVPLNFRRFLVMDRERERVLSAYERLRVHHPALPPNLRDFQVVFHMKRGNFGGEFFLSRSTWSVLWPIAKQGTTCWEPCQPAMGSPCPCWWPLFSFRLVQNLRTCTCLLYLNLTFTGSTIVVICPLTTIAQQLMNDCSKYGINALAGHQVKPEEFETTLKSNRPRMIIANVEFIASPEVRLVVRDQLWQSALGERCSSGL